jgi:ADP-ribose pyrophosphatase YjhB (NUDIX family)
MNVKHSVALAIRDDARPGMLLLVQRPPDDEDLPDVWGLPAATLTGDETPVDGARRAGRDKLGIELEIGGVLNEGSRDRGAYRLEMQLLDARVRSGSPRTDRHIADDTTRYQAWRWGPVAELGPAAERGSLCSRLALEAGLGG